ncbi:MAG: transposase [Patescibacteria group bacterium]
MTRTRAIAQGEYYHVFNRGTHRMPLVKDKSDWMRFLFLVLYSQSPVIIKNTLRMVQKGSLIDGFPVSLDQHEEIVAKRFVELTAFCLMPNHFHLLLRESEEGGSARYLQKLETAYTMYFNTKYQSTGHVFQGRYKSVHVKDNNQLLYLSAYIHRNPRELTAWRAKEESYPYSSLQDYVDKNRWGSLIVSDIIAGQFGGTTQSNYQDFVRTSTAKILAEELQDILPESI